jgi:hypothetical protein
MKADPIEMAMKSLADKWQLLLIHCANRKIPAGRVSAENLIEDGRKRKKVYAELVRDGYVDEADYVTSKAWDEMLCVSPGDLSLFYKFDAHEANKGIGGFITFDRLNRMMQKAVIVAMQNDPASYKLMFVNDRYNPIKVEAFSLGGGGDAREKIGGYDARLVVTCPALEAQHSANMRQHYKDQCLNAGLNWFLKREHANTGVVDVPVCEKQPFLGGHASLDRDPTKWEASLPDTIKRTQQAIAEAQQRLAALQKLESTVLLMGGWEAFLAKYDAAVEGYVAENYGKAE